jgi:hypothetical protein
VRQALLATVVWLAACTPAPAGDVLAVDQARFRVTVPDRWDARATNPADWADGHTVALLASQSLDPQCGQPEGCTAPVATLNDRALLMWWRSATCAGTGCEPPDGERLLVGGRPASRVEGSHLCDAMAATGEEAYLVAVTPQRVDAVVVCERNAGEGERSAMRAVLESVDWQTP